MFKRIILFLCLAAAALAAPQPEEEMPVVAQAIEFLGRDVQPYEYEYEIEIEARQARALSFEPTGPRSQLYEEEALDKNARVAQTSKKNFEEDQDAPLLT